MEIVISVEETSKGTAFSVSKNIKDLSDIHKQKLTYYLGDLRNKIAKEIIDHE